MFHTYTFEVNGFSIEAKYSEHAIQTIFIPLLKRLTKLQEAKQERLIVFLAAAPAVGKSTLASFLSYLSKTTKEIQPVQSIGLDGFHYPQNYIEKHMVVIDGIEVPMVDVKGCPETFDIEKIFSKIQQMKKSDVKWPIYDRNLHDVVEDVTFVNQSIVLIEGNWLLLKDEKWCELTQLCDFSILVHADEALLKDRLIQRKMMGGSTKEEATAFYKRSDGKNIQRVISCSQPADIEFVLCENGDYIDKKGTSERNE